jgi:hypothetical protein
MHAATGGSAPSLGRSSLPPTRVVPATPDAPVARLQFVT